MPSTSSLMFDTTNQVNNGYSLWFFTDLHCQNPDIGSSQMMGGGCSEWGGVSGVGPSAYITTVVTSPYMIQYNTNTSYDPVNYIGAEPNVCFQAPYSMTNSVDGPVVEGWILTIEEENWILSQYTPNSYNQLCGTFIRNLTMNLNQWCEEPSPEYYNNIYVLPTPPSSH